MLVLFVNFIGEKNLHFSGAATFNEYSKAMEVEFK